jgi:Arc/MetJ-type ribon-helix-helix transcriptional regulator
MLYYFEAHRQFVPVVDNGAIFLYAETEGLDAMHITPTDDQRAFIRGGIQAGRFAREEDALKEALSLWEVRERRRAEIPAAVDQAEASLARGEGRRFTTIEETAQLADDIKRRGLARLHAEQNRS